MSAAHQFSDNPERVRRARRLARRHASGKAWQALFLAATALAIVVLAALLGSIVNQAFGLVAVEDKLPPAALADAPLESLSSEALIAILTDNLTAARLRAVEREQPLESRSQRDLYNQVMERVVQPEIVSSYYLFDSLFNRAEIERETQAKFPGARVEFRAWLNPGFITAAQSSQPEIAGVRTALFGSLWIILVTVLAAFPIGVGAAVYLEEYAGKSRLNRIIQTNIDNLAGVPSILYGILGLAIFVRALGRITSGGAGDNGRTILSAGLTLALLVLPLLIINAQEAIRAVPNSLRMASYGLGATRWQTIWHHVLPGAMPGILTGAILSVSRALGETAPLIVVGASTLINRDPRGPFSQFTALPIQIYNWTTRPQDAYHHLAAAAILVLLMALLSLNAFAIVMRNRLASR